MSKNSLGKLGEEMAFKYISEKGYTVLERNWRTGRFELDIVASKNGVLVFFEVKTRSNNNFGYPEESVNYIKEKHITKASLAFIHQIGHKGEVRYDLISILMHPDLTLKELEHIEDAFFPGL